MGQRINNVSQDIERVYVRMIHAPSYKSFLPRIYYQGTTEVCVGKKTVDIIISDPDEIYDVTFERGITIHGSPRIVEYIKRLVDMAKQAKLDLEEVMERFLSLLDRIGGIILEKTGYDLPHIKPFVILETTPETILRILDMLRDPEKMDDAEKFLIENSRMIVVVHRWRSLDEIREEAERICKQKIKLPRNTEDYDAMEEYDAKIFDCIQDLSYEIALKEKPKVLGAVYLVNGKIVAKGKDVLNFAKDLLPAYESSKLRELE